MIADLRRSGHESREKTDGRSIPIGVTGLGMTSLPPTPLKDIDTLPDGAAIITDEELIDISASFEAEAVEGDDEPTVPIFEGKKYLDSPTRRPPARSFDEEPTRKQHAPKPPRKKGSTDENETDPWSRSRPPSKGRSSDA